MFDCPTADVHQHYQNRGFTASKRVEAKPVSFGQYPKVQCAVAIDAGLTGGRIWIDALQIGVLTPQMRHLTEAAPVYYAHRDTWYANPLEQVNILASLGGCLC